MRLCTLALLLVASVSWADMQFNVNWTPPDTRADGSPLPATSIAGYKLWATPPGGMDSTQVDVPPGNSFTYEYVGSPIYGEWCFTMATLDADGRESETSAPSCSTVIAVPNPPTNIIITITVK